MNHHCACHFLLLQTFKSEGFFALYRGFVPQFLRLFPWNVIVSLNEFLSCRHFCVSLKQFFYYFLNTSLKPCSILQCNKIHVFCSFAAFMPETRLSFCFFPSTCIGCLFVNCRQAILTKCC